MSSDPIGGIPDVHLFVNNGQPPGTSECKPNILRVCNSYTRTLRQRTNVFVRVRWLDDLNSQKAAHARNGTGMYLI